MAEAAITDAQAARFLQQAQFSSLPAEIESVKRDGYNGWLNRQYATPPGKWGGAWLVERGHNAITEKGEYFAPQMGDFMAWSQLLTAPDQMRKRCALALSEYFVVSLDPIDGFWPPFMISGYWDLLCSEAFGNFRTLLERVTLNPAMGMYLNTKGNLKEDEDEGRLPDENYAREIMQLFTIGLHQLNPDGTVKLDASGSPIETYNQEDVTNLARVFTGYDHDFSKVRYAHVKWLDYPVPTPQFAVMPMKFDPKNHSTKEVRFLGTTIPADTPGPDALKIALDTLFEHPNTPPFFCRQMIQRFVTSNPSPRYVRRVAMIFEDNGAGVRGDLSQVWRAILLDPEARRDPDPRRRHHGKLREPMVRYVQWAHTVGVRSETGAFEIYSLGRSDEALGQSPLRSPSVFNFFRPGYVPPQTEMAERGLAAPEFQLVNESSVAGYVNFLQWAIHGGYNDVKPTYDALLPLAHDPGALVDWLDLHFTARQLSPKTRARIETALGQSGVVEESPLDRKRALLAAACLLVMSAPEYIVQK